MKLAPVSVVIPTFNKGCLVAEAVESVLAQTLLPAEIIVVDDGSRDDTRERLAAYRERIQYAFQENRGVSAARNHGVRRATSDLIAFLDSDDVWHPRKLEIQVEALAQNPGLGLLGTASFDWPAPMFPALRHPASGPLALVP